MRKLSPLQQNVLTGFLEAADSGVQGVGIGAYKHLPVRALLNRGYIELDPTKTLYRITDAGRAAVSSSPAVAPETKR